MKTHKIKLTAFLLTAAMILSGCNSDNITLSGGEITESGNITSAPENTESSDSPINSDNSENTESSDGADIPLNSESSENTDNSEDKDSPVNSEESSAPTEDAPFTAEWRLTTTWEAEGMLCGGYEAVIYNNSDSALDGWELKVRVPDGFEIIHGWNGEYEVNGTVLIIKNVDYNAELAVGANVGFGFNFSAPTEFKPQTATLNDKPVKVTESSEQENSGESSPVNPETQAPETQAPPVVIEPEDTTAHVSTHGKLSVKGTQLVDKDGKPYQLRGMSTHGLGWFPDMVNEENFRTLRDDWNTNVVRLAMYSGEGEGYTGVGKKTYEALMKKGIEICIKLDMYVIVDWHVLGDQSPQVMKTDALRFFDEITREYGKYPNLIYEICNEPNGYASWEQHVKPYAEEVIPVIRRNAPDSVIIVGTPTWSQDIDKAMNNPLQYDNIMYALHFYADTHTDWLRDRLKQCNGNGLPVMVTEFGCCDASGNGRNNFDQTTKWLTLLDSLGISYMNWSLGNKDETASALRPNATMDGKWDDSELSESGKWMRDWFRKH